MFFLYFLMLIFAVDAESEQIFSALEEIKSVLSTVNRRLERIEDRQTAWESKYDRLEEKINGIEKVIRQRHYRSFRLLKKTVSLLNERKVKDEGLETRQRTMISQLNQLVNSTDRCQDNSTSTSISTTQPPATTTGALQDCKTVSDGVYQLTVGNRQIQVFCADGFVTFQRRYNGQLSFDKTFSKYEQGFGTASSEHWMGLRYLHLMTKGKSCTFRARLAVDRIQRNRDFCGTAYAEDCDGKIKEIVARDFRVSSAADKYRINIVFNHTDFLHPSVQRYFKDFNGQRFTTKDQDNDQFSGVNCASLGHYAVNGGFWYNDCEPGYPNSVVYSDNRCSNSVCGIWFPYIFTSSLLQFSC